MKKFLCLVATALCFASFGFIAPQNNASAEDVVQKTLITTSEELSQITSTGAYVLMANITLTSWTPIDFQGTFDGNGFKITTPTNLFKTANGANISNLGIIPAQDFTQEITSGLNVNTNFGILAQNSINSQISNVYVEKSSVTLQISCGSNIGGLVGYATNATKITDCYSRADFVIQHSSTSNEDIYVNFGGLVGSSEGTIMANCYVAPQSTNLLTLNTTSNEARINANLGGLFGKATSSGYDNIVNNFCGGNFVFDYQNATCTKNIGKIFGQALGFSSSNLIYNNTFNSQNFEFIADSGNYTPSTFTQVLSQYFQSANVYAEDYEDSIWYGLNKDFVWDLNTVWCKNNDSNNEFLSLQMFQNFSLAISEINNGLGCTAEIQQLSGGEFVATDDRSFAYNQSVRIKLSITEDFEHYKKISGLKRIGLASNIDDIVISEDGKSATYTFNVNGSTAGEFYGLTENVQYKLKLQSENNAEGIIKYGTSGGTISSEPYILEYGKKEFTFYASPVSNSYAFESWTWVGITDNPSLYLPENKLINIKFGVVEDDTSFTYLTMPTDIPTTVDGDGSIVFTLQANFTTNVCNLEITTNLSDESCDIYVGGLLLDNIIDFTSVFNESIQVNQPIEIRIEMNKGYSFVRWENASGRDITKSLATGETATSMTIHLTADSDFVLNLVVEEDNQEKVDLTWLWIVLGCVGGAGLVVLAVFLIKNRRRKEDFLSYY